MGSFCRTESSATSNLNSSSHTGFNVFLHTVVFCLIRSFVCSGVRKGLQEGMRSAISATEKELEPTEPDIESVQPRPCGALGRLLRNHHDSPLSERFEIIGFAKHRAKATPIRVPHLARSREDASPRAPVGNLSSSTWPLYFVATFDTRTNIRSPVHSCGI